MVCCIDLYCWSLLTFCNDRKRCQDDFLRSFRCRPIGRGVICSPSLAAILRCQAPPQIGDARATLLRTASIDSAATSRLTSDNQLRGRFIGHACSRSCSIHFALSRPCSQPIADSPPAHNPCPQPKCISISVAQADAVCRLLVIGGDLQQSKSPPGPDSGTGSVCFFSENRGDQAQLARSLTLDIALRRKRQAVAARIEANDASTRTAARGVPWRFGDACRGPGLRPNIAKNHRIFHNCVNR